MFVFSMIAILMASAIIAYKKDSELAGELGKVFIIAVLIAYVLAFFRGLGYIDHVCIALDICMFFWVIRNSLIKDVLKKFITPTSLALFIVTLLIFVLCSDAGINIFSGNIYQAIQLKELYYLNGMSGRFENVMPAYGDYPYGTALWEWLFCHIDPHGFREALGLAGYHCMNLFLLMPVIGRLKLSLNENDDEEENADEEVNVSISKNSKYRFVYESYRLKSKYKVHVSETGDDINRIKVSPISFTIELLSKVLLCFGLLFVPSVACSTGLGDISPDITMGILYGMLIICILEYRKEAADYYLNILVYGCMIILCRNWGLLWLIAASVLAAVMIRRYRDPIEEIRYIILLPTMWLTLFLSWTGYCIYAGRVSELTRYVFHMITFRSGQPTEVSIKALEMIKALTVASFFCDRVGLIRISPLIALLVVIVFIVLLKKKSAPDGFDVRPGIVYFVITFIISYLVIFAVYIHLWENPGFTLTETALNKGVPYVLSAIIYVIGMTIKEISSHDPESALRENNIDRQMRSNSMANTWKGYIFVVLFITLSCDLGLIFNRTANMVNITLENDQGYRDLKEEIGSHIELPGHRVLYLTDIKADYNKDIAVQYELTPVSITTVRISDEFGSSAIKDIINNSHAGYIYTDAKGDNINSIFEDLCREKWESKKIYRIFPDTTLGYIDIEKGN